VLHVPGALDAVVDEVQADGDGEEEGNKEEAAGSDDAAYIWGEGGPGGDGPVERLERELFKALGGRGLV